MLGFANAHPNLCGLLDAMRECGFAEAEALRIGDPERGLPEAQWVLRARR